CLPPPSLRRAPYNIHVLLPAKQRSCPRILHRPFQHGTLLRGDKAAESCEESAQPGLPLLPMHSARRVIVGGKSYVRGRHPGETAEFSAPSSQMPVANRHIAEQS